MTPLGGIRVIECGVAIAGPVAARYLAHLGAEVIKIDNRAEALASAPWWAPKDLGPAGADLVSGALSGNKRSLGLNLKAPEARPILEKLVAASDVFVTNLSRAAPRTGWPYAVRYLTREASRSRCVGLLRAAEQPKHQAWRAAGSFQR